MDADTSNGKVTLALIGQKLDALTQAVDRYNAEQTRLHAELERRLHVDELAAEKRETRLCTAERRIDDLDEDVEGLKGSDRKWGGFTALLAVVGSTIAGVIGGSR